MTQPPLMAYSQDRAADIGTGRKIASALTWFGVAVMSLIVLSGCTAVLLPRVFIVGSPMIVLVAFVIVATMMRRIRLNRAYITIAYLEAATRLNLPLSPIMTAAAQSEGGALAASLALFGSSLQDGFSVAASLGRAVPEVPPDIINEIEAGEAIGRLPQTLRRLLTQRRRKFTPGADEQILSRVYPLFILLFTSGVLSLFLILIVPKFQEIFRDFRVDLPRATQILVAIGNSYTLTFLGPVFTLLLALVFTAITAGRLRRIFVVREMPALSRPVTDWLLWRTPFYGAIVREDELARVCQFLAEALRQGLPLLAAVDVAERLPQNTSMRTQLLEFRSALLGGSTISQAAAAAGFPHGMIDLLLPAERTGSVSEALGFLAAHYRWRTDRRKTLLVAALQPAMVLGVGTIVGFIAFALFSPLVKLIQSVSGFSGSL